MYIQRGQRGKLEQYFQLDTPVEIRMQTTGSAVYDYCCFGVDSADQLSDDRYMVFYNQKISPKSEIVHRMTGQRADFTVSLNSLPANICKLVFTVSIDGFGTMGEIFDFEVSINQGSRDPIILQLDGSDFSREKAIISFEIYNKNGWRFSAVARGFNGGLGDLLRAYGGEEEQDASAAPAPAPLVTPPAAMSRPAPAPQVTPPAPMSRPAPAPQVTPAAPMSRPAPAPQVTPAAPMSRPAASAASSYVIAPATSVQPPVQQRTAEMPDLMPPVSAPAAVPQNAAPVNQPFPVPAVFPTQAPPVRAAAQPVSPAPAVPQAASALPKVELLKLGATPVNLKKHEKVELRKPDSEVLRKVVVGLGWEPAVNGLSIDCDSSVFMCQNGKLCSGQDIVAYYNLKHFSGAVVHQGDNLTGAGDGDDEQIVIDLTAVPPSYDRIVVVVNIFMSRIKMQHFGKIRNCYMRLCDNTGKELCRYTLSDSAEYNHKSAMIFGELLKQNDVWIFHAIGQGTNDHSIGGLAKHFK